MMTRHTPGPWEMGEEVDSQDRLVYIPIRRGKLHISTTGVYGKKPDGSHAGAKYTDRFGIERVKPIISAEECRANARLIAASPELLAVCQSILEQTEGPALALFNLDNARALLAAAIAKATGGD